MTANSKHFKKLIEVSLPLPEINDASSYDKMPGIGPHPKGIHHWWARLPLPTARAVLFASVVDDPEAHPEKYPTEEVQNAERERLFGILRQLMEKRLHEAPEVYAKAQAEMLKHCDGKLPAVFDPFAGGGSIPLEANRLGFEAHAGDLNPVAVLLNKCNLELAPRWRNHPPINPEDRGKIGGSTAWQGTDGLAADIRYFGRVVHERTLKRIGHLYPKARLPKGHNGGDATVIAWIWARTVASPKAWLEPVVDKAKRTYRFEVRTGSPKDRGAVAAGTKVGRGGFRCLLSDDPIPFDYIRTQGQKNALGETLVAIIAEAGRGRAYLAASDEQVNAAYSADPHGYPETDLPEQALGFRVQNYGVRHHWQMFTPRQLTALVSLSESVRDIWVDAVREATASGMTKAGGEDYAKTITTFLTLVIDRCVSFNNRFCRWNGNQTVFIFTRQAIPMLWDFSEANIMGERAVCWYTAYNICADAIATIASNDTTASASQIDAASGANGIANLLVSTDPPYYDNIGYAALSDFFYVWLRPLLGGLYGDLFSTVLVPKQPELTASPERFDGDKNRAKEHFESGFRRAFTGLRNKMDARFPLTVYYAFRQDDESSEAIDEDDTETIDSTTGWETLLEALISSGFQITATWPVRASFSWRMRALSSNALASYIVLACRPRLADAAQISSVQFRQELKRTLPAALRHLQQGNIAPVDFAQAAIGPGMAVYSRYSRILDSAGKNLSVRAALGIINQTLTEVLSELEDDFDADTRWAIAWFEEYGFAAGDYGNAEVLSKAKATSVSGLNQAGLVQSKGGKVRLVRPEELAKEWEPTADQRLTVWGMTHHLLRLYHHQKAGDEATAALLRRLGSNGEVARELAYRLFKIAENKKLSSEAQGYNSLFLCWPEIARIARTTPTPPEPIQRRLI
jgi:putative DNA methylase